MDSMDHDDPNGRGAITEEDSFQPSQPTGEGWERALTPDEVATRIYDVEEDASFGQLRVRVLRLEELMSSVPSHDVFFSSIRRMEQIMDEQFAQVRSNALKQEDHLKALIAEQIQNTQQDLLSAVQTTAARACESAYKVMQPHGDSGIGLHPDDLTRLLTPFFQEEGEERKKATELMMQRLDDVEGALAEINARCEEQCSALGKRLSEVQSELEARPVVEVQNELLNSQLLEVKENLATECEERKQENKVQREFLQEMNSGLQGILSKVGDLDDSNPLLQKLQRSVDRNTATPATQNSEAPSPSVASAYDTVGTAKGTPRGDASWIYRQPNAAVPQAGSVAMPPRSPRTLTRAMATLNNGPTQYMRPLGIDPLQSMPQYSLFRERPRSQSRERYLVGNSAPASLVPPFPGRAGPCLSPGRGLSPACQFRAPSLEETKLSDALLKYSMLRSSSPERGWASSKSATPMRSRDPSREDVRLRHDGSFSFALGPSEIVHERAKPVQQVEKSLVASQAIPAQHVTAHPMLTGPAPRLQQPSPVPLPQQHAGAAQPKLAAPRGSSPTPAPQRSNPSGPGSWQAIR